MKKLLLPLLIFSFSAVSDEYNANYFSNTITENDLKRHLTFLASDSLRGRLAGSIEQKVAAEYIAKHFWENGLTAVVPESDTINKFSYFQPFYIKEYFGSQYSVMFNPSEKMRKGKGVISTENVLGFLEGTDKKEEVLVISAHYDHIGTMNDIVFNGADDDGSGTVAMMEIAQAFTEAKKKGKATRRSILFIAFTGEECGLLGSEYYTEKPIFPLRKTICDLNIDMIGRIDNEHIKQPNYVYLILSYRKTKLLRDISVEMNQNSVNLNLDYTYNSESHPLQLYSRSDHYNFVKNNVPFIFYFDGIHPDYHAPTDDVERIDFTLLKKRTDLIFHTAWEIANQEGNIR